MWHVRIKNNIDKISNYFTVTWKILLLRGFAPTAKELAYIIVWLVECGLENDSVQNSPLRYFSSPMSSNSNALNSYTFKVTYATVT